MKLILLPGMDGTGKLFDALISELGRDIEPVVLSFPGGECLDYAQLCQLVRPGLPRGEPYVLLGESFSGPAVVLLAAEEPAGLCGLILCASFVSNPRPGLGRLGRLATFFPLNALPESLVALPLLNRFPSQDWRRKLATAIGQNTADVLRARLRAVLAADVSSSARQIRLPALYLRATGDRLVPAKAAQQVLDCIPHLQIMALDGPHMLLQSNAKQAAGAIRSFIERECRG